MKKAASGRKRQWWLVRFALVAAAFCGAFVFLAQKKDRMLKECTRFLETSLSRQTDLRVRVDRIGGNAWGLVRIEGLSVEEPPASGGRTLFSAREVTVRYRFLDFLSKSPSSGIEIFVDRPEVYWAPNVRLRTPDFPFLAWMRDAFLGRREGVTLRARDLDFFYGPSKSKIGGIQLEYRSGAVRLQVPFSHVALGDADVSSRMTVDGRYYPGEEPELDEIRGTVFTEGTVVNWKPASRESSAEFVFSRRGLAVTTSDVLGVEVTGGVDLRDFEMDFTAKAADYPLSEVGGLLGASRSFSLPGRADAELRLRGLAWSPELEAWIRLRDGLVGRRAFKALDLHVQGNYPTVRLEGSRILLEDGTAMRFADTTLEITELLKEKTLTSLIAEAHQDTVVWGDWELSRAEGRTEGTSDFLMQRAFGENARVHFRRYNDEEEYPNRRETARDEPRQMELGFEYRLRSEDSVKLELRDGEEFVGVERKMKF